MDSSFCGGERAVGSPAREVLRETLSGCMWGTDGEGKGGRGESSEEVDGPGLGKAEDLGESGNVRSRGNAGKGGHCLRV